jgi:hypothetical protein
MPDAETRQPNITTFHGRSFELERTAKTTPEIWVDHDPAIRVGKVWALYTSRGWWMCDMALDPELPNELEVGQPLSVGLSYLRIGSGEPYLREISIVSRGAVPGAEITRRSELPPPAPKPQPTPAKPLAARAPAAAATALVIHHPERSVTLSRPPSCDAGRHGWRTTATAAASRTSSPTSRTNSATAAT